MNWWVSPLVQTHLDLFSQCSSCSLCLLLPLQPSQRSTASRAASSACARPRETEHRSAEPPRSCSSELEDTETEAILELRGRSGRLLGPSLEAGRPRRFKLDPATAQGRSRRTRGSCPFVDIAPSGYLSECDPFFGPDSVFLSVVMSM